MNRIADSLVWIVLTLAAFYGVYVGYTSLVSHHGTMAFDSQSPLLKDLKNRAGTQVEEQPIEQQPVVAEEVVEEKPITAKKYFTDADIARIKAVSQSNFDRFMRRLDDLIGEEITIKQESKGTRVSEYREILNLTLNTKLSIITTAGEDFVKEVNALKKSLNMNEDSLAGKTLHETLKKLLFEARNL